MNVTIHPAMPTPAIRAVLGGECNCGYVGPLRGEQCPRCAAGPSQIRPFIISERISS
jgi:hypothetical protein